MDWRTEAYWEVDFRFFDMFPDVYPDKELGIDDDECCFNVIRDEHYKYVHFSLWERHLAAKDKKKGIKINVGPQFLS